MKKRAFKLSIALLLLFLFAHNYNSTAQIISTFAGTNVDGYSGNGGPATKARLNEPTGVCADNKGNIYFADQENHVIRKVNSAGIGWPIRRLADEPALIAYYTLLDIFE